MYMTCTDGISSLVLCPHAASNRQGQMRKKVGIYQKKLAAGYLDRNVKLIETIHSSHKSLERLEK